TVKPVLSNFLREGLIRTVVQSQTIGISPYTHIILLLDHNVRVSDDRDKVLRTIELEAPTCNGEEFPLLQVLVKLRVDSRRLLHSADQRESIPRSSREEEVRNTIGSSKAANAVSQTSRQIVRH